ncbi:sulfite exporter TauE/SafE family protein [Pseudoalteromonas sp. HL-AS2]|uniref:sulfite exporter TauE/SafE family protein n=1 Tax=Pseudoalteromonas TaxID=53246 RepID=UPI00178887CC|nr:MULTISPECIES: sulfite exporter TauE/SafE family protein [Pseudoalteromonas]MBE0420440.1 sulfite exporter TauE/SafE family protein [Pseudoalteromonas nigrifaciens]WMS93354.1 sulfite exporter TauE/SafE family protein [Pseudoalteromonas sp. HL-AS2]
MDITTLVLIAAVVVLIGVSKSAFAGALGVFAVPLLMLKLPAAQAIALMLPLLIIGDMLSVRSYWRKWDDQLLLPLIPGAIVGVLIAYLIIDVINAKHLRLIIALICIVFSIKNIFFKKSSLKILSNKIGAGIMSMFSGITSSLVHAGGPPIIIYFTAIGLTPGKFVATAAIFFAMMNVIKLIAALSFGLLTGETILTALAFFPLAFVGNWLGVKINEVLDKVLFLKIMNYLLLVLGFWLLLGK